MLKVLESAVDQGCSDVHLVVGRPPDDAAERRDQAGQPGLFVPRRRRDEAPIYGMLVEAQRDRFETNWELDSSFAFPPRALPGQRAPDPERRRGRHARHLGHDPGGGGDRPDPGHAGALGPPARMVLVVGPTGSGKSTTLACLMERANYTRTEHIITIEDPIEFVYEAKQCIVRQREVGLTTKSFSNALRACLREDPNIILVGEMRDYETIGLAVTAAETGHLCFGTLHTQDAPSTVARIIDVFPANQQTQIRVQLATRSRPWSPRSSCPRRTARAESPAGSSWSSRRPSRT